MIISRFVEEFHNALACVREWVVHGKLILLYWMDLITAALWLAAL